MKYTLYMTEVSTTWVDRDQCPQFNTGEEFKGILSVIIQVSDQRQQRTFSKQTQKQREILGQVFCTLVSSPNAVWNLGFNFNTLFERKISKNMFFVLKCGKTNY